MAELTAKRRAFCEAYLRLLNATAAAIEAGYAKSSAHQRGYELLQRYDIHTEIARLRAIRDQEVAITAADVLRELAVIAMADPGDLLAWGTKVVTDPNGSPILKQNGQPLMVPSLIIIPSNTLTPVQRRTVKNVSMSRSGAFKIEMHDRLKALELLGRHLSIFDHNQGKAGNTAGCTVAELVAAAQGKPLVPVTEHLEHGGPT